MSERSRDEWMHWCGANGLPSWTAARILRRAADVQRAAEVACSINDDELRAYWDARDARARAAIKSMLDEHESRNGGKWSVEFDGDPRGLCVHVALTVGGELRRYGVPARGFTASEFARLERVSELRGRAAVTR